MELNYTLIFRILVSIYTLIIAYFSYDIYKKTKGGNTQWKYFASAFIVGFLWALSELLFKSIIPNNFLFYLVSFSLLIILSYFLIKVSCNFLKSFTTKSFKGFKEKDFYIAFAIIFALWLIYNSSGFELIKLKDIIALITGLGFLITSFSFYIISRYQKNFGWKLLVPFFFGLGIGIIMLVFLSTCCYINPEGSGCADFQYAYTKSLPSFICYSPLMQIYSFANLIMVASSIFLVGVYFLWKHIYKTMKMK